MLAGTHVWKAQDILLPGLQESGALLAHFTLTHSYPHCWRHKTPVAFRATPQWFISMEANDLRKNALAAIDAVELLGVEPSDVAPDHWRQVHNRLKARAAPEPYTLARHRAWQLRDAVGV